MSIAHLLVSGLRAPLAWLLSLVKIQGSLFRLKENVTYLLPGPGFRSHTVLESRYFSERIAQDAM